jgi:hypothetical protein
MDYPFVHVDDLGEIIGNFHGIPVRSWDAKASAARECRDIRLTIYNNHKAEMKQQATVADHEHVDIFGIIQPNTAQVAAVV